jgi:hypothetical protein
LEFEVAMLILGISLTGLLPLIVMQSRGLQVADQRIPWQTTCYLVPVANEWARKLGASARITAEPPEPTEPPLPPVLDDGDAGYSESGAGWTPQTDPQAFQGDHRCHAAVQGGAHDPSAGAASWQFTGVTPGWYELQATWVVALDRSPTVGYAVYRGLTSLGTFRVSQKQPPSGAMYLGVPWQTLTRLWIGDAPVRVELGTQNNGSVAADGMRLVPVRNDVRVLSLERSLASEDMTVHVAVDVVVP